MSLIPVTIEKSKWCRGRNNERGLSYLLGPYNTMCCLGFCELAIGKTEDEIMMKALPKPPDIWDYGVKGKLINSAAMINDNTLITDEKRIEKLIPILREIGFEPTFVD